MAKEPMDQIVEAVSSDCPQTYANGFAASLGVGDIVIAFQRNDQPAIVLNLSFTVAKTLSVKLGEMIGDLEKKTSQTIMTTDQIIQSLNRDNTPH